ncbi:pectinesterase inhibitor-like [Cornus florida]|uniref:pectinesterase inhibitor-like n=1 Tax=Cornus florida TaxID=4283 RepID=UPI00289C6705|nr:pectinesterase inhibitor-like [Cornus florida]
MASSLSVSSSLLLPIFLSFLFINHTHAATNELITSICSSTTNPSLCVQSLKSDPRTASADLKGLGAISIDIAQSNAKSTLNMIVSLVKQTTDPKLKGRYDTCRENYDDSVSDFDECRKFLKSGDYASLNTYASSALDGPDTCNDGFEGPPAEPPQLQAANKKLEGLCSIVLAISNRL